MRGPAAEAERLATADTPNLLVNPVVLECRRVFVKVHKRAFCSARCQKRVFMRRFRRDDYEPRQKKG